MLNKIQIINIMKEMDLPSDQYWITAGAGMVMHGLKTSTRDIDIGCTTALIEELIAKGYEARQEGDGTRIMKLGEYIEIFENWKVDGINLIEGLPIGSLEGIKQQKLKLGREKDMEDIRLIDKYFTDLYKIDKTVQNME